MTGRAITLREQVATIDTIYLVSDSLFILMSDSVLYGGFYAKGNEGAQGAGIDSVYIVGDSLYVVTDTITYGGFYVAGPQGDPGASGSGDDNWLAMWLNDTLTESLIYQGADSTLRFYYRGTTNPMILIDGDGQFIRFDSDANGTYEYQLLTTTFGGIATGDPQMSTNTNMFSYYADDDLGMKRPSANFLALHAGDATNPVIEIIGDSDRIDIDPNDDNAIDIILNDTMAIFEKVQVSTTSDALTTGLTGFDGTNIFTEIIIGSGLTLVPGVSNDTLTASGAGVTGSGTTGEVAVWSSSTALTSNGWSMTSTVLQGGATGDPAISLSANMYTFNGDTDTGIDRSAADEISIHAGDATNPTIKIDGTNNIVSIDPDDDANQPWTFDTNKFGQDGALAGNPQMNNSLDAFTFWDDETTFMKWSSAGVLSFHAGDATNNMVELDGANNRVTFDPNDDGTDDITFRDTMALFEKIYLSAPSAATTTTLTGYDAGNVLTEVIIGSGLTLNPGASFDTLTASSNTSKDFAELSLNSTFDLTSLSTTNIDWAGASTIESAGLDADVANDEINPLITATVLVTFTAQVYNPSSAYTGTLNLYLYKNGSYANKSYASSHWSAGEYKTISFSGLLSVTPNDQIEIWYDITSATTLTMSIPTLTVTQVD
jgi:hypothetical protein